ncbi:MAG: hypothetical protein C0598_07905 [Marinilabiliales bacterium]|nr:MAG: hypothetical protein C0598_07905 [Marinilabiliales bacterium]
MKKYFLILVALLTLTNIISSQDFDAGDLKKRTYIRFGLANPTFSYYGFTDKEDMISEIGYQDRLGGIFEVGTIYPINKLKIAKHLRMGINVDWFALKTHLFKVQNSDLLVNYFVQSKIGLAFSYPPVKLIQVDVYGKASPIWYGGTLLNYPDMDFDEDNFNGYLQFMYSTGINLKLAFIILGFEYEFGNLKLKNANEEFLGNMKNESSKTPMSGLNFSLGVVF